MIRNSTNVSSMHIKSLVISLYFICLLAVNGTSQFSVFAKYQPNQIEWQDEWQTTLSDDIIYQHSINYGLAYWLRLKNYRVEFHPGIYYSQSEQAVTLNSVATTHIEIPEINSIELNGFGFEVPVHFYFLDLEGDCNCPTFSKQGNVFSKGIYAYFNPGVRRLSYSLGIDNGTADNSENQVLLTVAAGVGLDIGLGDLFTITPFGGLEFVPNMQWDAYDSYVEILSDNAITNNRNLRSIVTGLRLSIRPDYIKEKKAMFR